MNKKIATRVGIMTSTVIVAYILWLFSQKVSEQSPLIFIQYGILLLGLLTSCYMLQRYYDNIQFLDYIKHCLRTLSTILFLMIAGTAIMHFIFMPKGTPFSVLTMKIMFTIFSYSLSGVLSSFFTSLIFNTFTKNK